MAFVCPRCKRVTLEAVASVDINDRDNFYEHAIMQIRCSSCDLSGAGEYEEFGGTMNGAEYRSFGFLYDAAGEDAIRLWFASEPRPAIEGLHSLAAPRSTFDLMSEWDHERSSAWKRRVSRTDPAFARLVERQTPFAASAMAFVCPRCERPTLDIVESVELAPDDNETQRLLQRIACDDCGISGGAEYHHDKLGAAVRESPRHEGCWLDPAGEDALRRWFAAPPNERPAVDGVRALASPASWFPMRFTS